MELDFEWFPFLSYPLLISLYKLQKSSTKYCPTNVTHNLMIKLCLNI